MTLKLRPTQAQATRDAPRLALRGGAPDQRAAEPQAPNRFESKARRREMLNFLRVRNAAEHLDHLPEPNCTIHGIMRGNYSYCDLIPAALKLIEPARFEYAAATTLGFSRKAALQLLDLIDAGHVRRLDFLCAHFFEASDPEICLFARKELTRRGSRFASARVHAKIILLAADNGARYTSESSANIRACQSIEQFALTNCPDLYEFHRQWIDETISQYAAPQKDS